MGCPRNSRNIQQSRTQNQVCICSSVVACRLTEQRLRHSGTYEFLGLGAQDLVTTAAGDCHGGGCCRQLTITTYQLQYQENRLFNVYR